jgi:hypothetical protein
MFLNPGVNRVYYLIKDGCDYPFFVEFEILPFNHPLCMEQLNLSKGVCIFFSTSLTHLLLTTAEYCPNNCSNRGECVCEGPNPSSCRCACFGSYFGPDCSYGEHLLSCSCKEQFTHNNGNLKTLLNRMLQHNGH